MQPALQPHRQAFVIQRVRSGHAACRLGRYYRCGAVFGKLCCCIAVVNVMYLAVLDWLEPASSFDLAPDHAPACSVPDKADQLTLKRSES